MLIFRAAFDDLRRSINRRDLWIYLGWFDIRQRYKRSLLGPWWITLSSSLFVFGLSLLWSNIFNMKLSEYMPYFVVAHVVWTFISTSIADSANGFVQFEHIIKQINIPFGAYVLRVLYRNIVVLLHNFAIVGVVFAVFPIALDVKPINFLLSIFNLFLFLYFIGIVLAVVCLRYRDLQQVVASAMTALFFITPIVWRPESVTGRMSLLIQCNPLAWYIANIRDSLLTVNVVSSFIPALVMTIISMLIGVYLLGKYKSRIPYWL
jgi:lipopolysaccharide transport system permease protein